MVSLGISHQTHPLDIRSDLFIVFIKQRYELEELSEEMLIELTEGQHEHPDWWEDYPCFCDMCKSYNV